MLNPVLHKEANGAGLQSKWPREKHSKSSTPQNSALRQPPGPWMGRREDWRAQHSLAGSYRSERRCCGWWEGRGLPGQQVQAGKSPGYSPQKVLHLNSKSCENKYTISGMEIAGWPTKKKHLTGSLLHFAMFFLICCSTAAEAFQNWFTLLCLKDVGIIPMQQD